MSKLQKKNCTRLAAVFPAGATRQAGCLGRLMASNPVMWGLAGRYTAAMKLLPLLTFVAVVLASAPVSAQWQWLDKDGRKVFSDRAPPPEVPEKSILRRPGGPLRGADEAASPTAPASGGPAPATGQDKELNARKKQAEDAEAAKRRQDEERMVRAQAETCERARRTKAGLDAGQRATRLNDKGEREFLDEAGVAAEIQRLQGIINESCKQAAQ